MALVNASILRQSLATRLGISAELAETRMRESILVLNGVYCGRKFVLDGYALTWFLEENQIKFFNPHGQIILACDASAFIAQDSHRQAA